MSKEIGGTPGWAHRLRMYSAADARVLLTVSPDGTIVMPDDLTIEEARSVIERLAPMAAQKSEEALGDGQGDGDR